LYLNIQAAEEAKRKAAAEAEAKRKVEEEAKRKAAAEAETKRKVEEEAKRKAAAEAETKRKVLGDLQHPTPLPSRFVKYDSVCLAPPTRRLQDAPLSHTMLH
jgi:hypothetical protein